MSAELQAFGRADFDSLLSWWIESGVDTPVGESTRDWLGQRPVSAPQPSASLAAPSRPQDLASFRSWLAEAEGLPMDRPGATRIPSHGNEGAPVMVLTDLPDSEDAAEGRPLGGSAWQLARRMIAAIGLVPDQAYVAALSPFHIPGGRFNGELGRCAELARDHVRLARPKRLILFGDATAKALTGESLARARGKLHRVEGVRTIATFHPRWLLQRPSDKALAWSDLLLLMSETE